MWAKLDDRFYENPRVVELTHCEFRLYVCAITFCYRQGRRDGFIGTGEAAVLSKLHGLRTGTVQGLIDKGRWEPRDGGWHIHDFEEYLPAETFEERQRRLGRQGGLRSAEGRRMKRAQQAGYEAGLEPGPESGLAVKQAPSPDTRVPTPATRGVSTSEGVCVPLTHDDFLDGPDLESIPGVRAWADAAKAAGKPLSVVGAGMLEIERQLPQHRDVPEDVLIAACRRAGGKGYSSGLWRDINAVLTERAASGSTIRDRHLARAAEMERCAGMEET